MSFGVARSSDYATVALLDRCIDIHHDAICLFQGFHLAERANACDDERTGLVETDFDKVSSAIFLPTHRCDLC